MWSIVESTGAHLRRGLILGAGLGPVLLAGCDVPEAPEWDVGLAVPFTLDRITILDLLPDDVDTATVDGRAAFTVAVQRDTVDYSLGQMCAACRPLHNLTFEVPTFDYVDSLDVLFPDELYAIEILHAGFSLQLTNKLNFDPLRPNPDPNAAGFITLAIRDLANGSALDSTFVGGDSASLRPGTTTLIDIDVPPGVELTRGFRVIFRIHSPQDGQTVQIDTSMTAGLRAELGTISVSAVTAMVDQKVIAQSFAITMDEDTRAELQGRVQGGEFEFELNHNVEIDGELEISIAGSDADLFSSDPTREIRLGPLTFTSGAVQRTAITSRDLEQLAAFPEVHIGYEGSAVGTRVSSLGQDKLTRLTPEQFLEARLKLTSRLRIGSSAGGGR